MFIFVSWLRGGSKEKLCVLETARVTTQVSLFRDD